MADRELKRLGVEVMKVMRQLHKSMAEIERVFGLEKTDAHHPGGRVVEAAGLVPRQNGARRGSGGGGKLGLASPGYLGKDESRGAVPPRKLKPGRVEYAEKSYRKIFRKVDSAMLTMPEFVEPVDFYPNPDWIPVPEGERRNVEIDGGGLFEELGEGSW